MTRLKLIGVLLAAVAFLVLPSAAGATLAYVKNVFHQHVYVAQDNGKGAREIGPGTNPRVSPNGKLVIFEREGSGHTPEMKLYDVATKKTRTILKPWRESFTVAWSPDSTMIAAQRGGEIGTRTLYVLQVGAGKLTRIATGYFEGVSFSPDNSELVFGLSNSQAYPPKVDVVRDPVTGGPTST